MTDGLDLSEPRTVHVLTLGGTISCDQGPGLGVVPALAAEEVARSVSAPPGVNLRWHTWSQTDSTELTFDTIEDLAREIIRIYQGGASGVVVTQGTDTLEESAFALDLLLGPKYGVVMTGAMRDRTRTGYDGARNLTAAIGVIELARSKRLGTVVVIDDDIHAAAWVTKRRTTGSAAFSSAIGGPIGAVVEDRPMFYGTPEYHRCQNLQICQGYEVLRADARVALLTTALDDAADLPMQIAPLGYAGLVVAAAGGGHTSARLARTLGDVASTIPTVLASRTGSGHVLQETYGSPGAEIDLINRGLIPAGALDALKARVLLTLLLRAGADRRAILNAFASQASARGGTGDHSALR